MTKVPTPAQIEMATRRRRILDRDRLDATGSEAMVAEPYRRQGSRTIRGRLFVPG
jgi:hypothetical protein